MTAERCSVRFGEECGAGEWTSYGTGNRFVRGSGGSSLEGG